MNDLQIFENDEFGEIRTAEIDGKIYFSSSDVAKALGYSNQRDAVLRHCKGVVKHDGVSKTTNQHGVTTEQTVELNFIPEGDVYRLITHSKLPSAERFERWVFDDVLPSVRKHGMYAKEDLLDNPDLLISVAQELKAERERNKALMADNERMRPKEIFADSVSASSNAILIGELAKLIKQNGVDIGQNRLFDWLRGNGYLISRKGADYNMPTQRAMEMKLFEIKERAINNPDGSVRVTKTTLVTGKGQIYFVNRFVGEERGIGNGQDWN